ncbi:MAG: efflux RND transporter permease subunit, partial [Rhodospirillaceae bacterium]
MSGFSVSTMTLTHKLGALAVAAVVVAGAFVFFGGEPAREGLRGNSGPRPVRAAVVEKEVFSDRLEAIGTVHANESVNVTAKVQGIIQSIYFDDGETVSRGEEIAAIDAGEQTAQLNVELANLEQQRKDLERARGLAEENHISQARVDELVAAVKKAEANVAAARVRAGDRLITAPFDGIVGTRRISVGALVSPGTVVTTLDDISRVNLDFAVPETFLSSLRPGLDIEAEASAYPGEMFEGEVIAVDSRIDSSTRSVTVRAEIPNEDMRLRPGMLMVVDLIQNRRDSLMIPEAALQPESDKQYVFIIGTDDVAERVEVVIGRRRAGFVEVVSGVEEGDVIIREGLQNLESGSKVNIVNRDEVKIDQPPPAQAALETHTRTSLPVLTPARCGQRKDRQMLLSDVSIKRPVVAIVASLLLVVFGLFAGMRLPVRETPDIDRPIVSVRVSYTGASAEIIESQVVRVIEEQIGGVQGIKAINAYSFDGGGSINIEFNVGRDIDEAANDVRDQVGRVLDRLPQDAEPPEIRKADPDSQPIMWLNAFSETRDAMELSDYVIFNLEPRFATVEGVAAVRVSGDREKAMRIWLDRRAMAARGITVSDVQTVLRQENIELGAGMLESVDRNYTMRTVRAYQTVEDFSNLVVARGENNYLVRLSEIARVELAPVDDKQVFRQGGRNGVGLGIIKQPGASTLAVSAAVRAEVEDIRRTKPDDMTLAFNTDSADYISAALREVVIAMAVAATMVVAVIYLFLGTVRAAIIPAVTVPISLIATAIALWPLGFSINILTLLAMVLAIGLVVDDAIIMLENIHRRMKLGEPPLLAAYRGAKQVGMAVVS